MDRRRRVARREGIALSSRASQICSFRFTSGAIPSRRQNGCGRQEAATTWIATNATQEDDSDIARVAPGKEKDTHGRRFMYMI